MFIRYSYKIIIVTVKSQRQSGLIVDSNPIFKAAIYVDPLLMKSDPDINICSYRTAFDFTKVKTKEKLFHPNIMNEIFRWLCSIRIGLLQGLLGISSLPPH